jgi:hypothetical protein
VFSPVQAAQLEGSVALAYPHALDLRITTRGLAVNALRSFGLAAIPLLSDSPSGTWRGWVRYQNEKWTAAAEMDGRLNIDGLASPLEVNSAAFSLAAGRLNVNHIAGRAGGIDFTGSYEDRRKETPRFSVAIAEVNAADLERLLAPLLARAGPNFIQRTLRSNASAPPAWLATRKVEGTIAIQSATATDASGEWKAHDITAQVEWDGPLIHVTGVTAKIDTASFGGLVDINLTAPIARYHLEGTLNEAAYRGGTLDLMGVVDAEGSGTQFLDSAHGEGTASGRAIVFAPGVVFGTRPPPIQFKPHGPSAALAIHGHRHHTARRRPARRGSIARGWPSVAGSHARGAPRTLHGNIIFRSAAGKVELLHVTQHAAKQFSSPNTDIFFQPNHHSRVDT